MVFRNKDPGACGSLEDLEVGSWLDAFLKAGEGETEGREACIATVWLTEDARVSCGWRPHPSIVNEAP